jgi:hypothetical protein
MNIDASDFIVGILVAVLGVLGLFLVSGAVDNEMYIFGLALFVFACLFDLGLIKASFDRKEAARAVGGKHV